MLVASYVCGISLLIFGILQVWQHAGGGNKLYLFGAVLTSIGGLCFLLMAMNGNKPFVKEGQSYLKISDKKIVAKLGKHTSKQEVAFDEITKVDIRDKEIVLRLAKGKEVWIDLHKIQNDDKKEAFIEIIKDFNKYIQN